MAKKVVTFGEIMLRLAPEGYYRFVQAGTYGATYGGGEANVAVSLANYGSTSLRRVQARDRPRLFMTAQVLPLQQQRLLILTGIRFLTVLTGSTSQESLLHLVTTLQQSA